MTEFEIGERVAFDVTDLILEGGVVRIDHRNATVISDDGRAWIIGTSLLSRPAPPTPKPAAATPSGTSQPNKVPTGTFER
jgi:hypothetical protein